jgi:hypothetical protein
MSNLVSFLFFIYLFTMTPTILLALGSTNTVLNYFISLPIVISLISLPILIKFNHNLDMRLYLVIIFFLPLSYLFIVTGKNKEIRQRIKKALLLYSFINLFFLVFLTIFSPIAYNFYQYTPDTYTYEFLARAINSQNGLIYLPEEWLLLRGLNLPAVLAIFAPNYYAHLIPPFVILILGITFIFYGKIGLDIQFTKLKQKILMYVLISTFFAIFLTTLQGAYGIFYITTHFIISQTVLVFFFTIHSIRQQKIMVDKLHFLLFTSCIYSFSLIRPEGIFLSFFAILYLVKEINLSFRYFLFIINSYFVMTIYWYATIFVLTNGDLSRFLTAGFFVLAMVSNILFIALGSKTLLYIKKYLLLIYLIFCISCFIYSSTIISQSFSECLKSVLLFDGGLGLIPYIIFIYFVILKFTRTLVSNKLIEASILGLLTTYVLYPVLNRNAWFCDPYSGWGGSLPRAWIHFIPLFLVGLLISLKPLLKTEFRRI